MCWSHFLRNACRRHANTVVLSGSLPLTSWSFSLVKADESQEESVRRSDLEELRRRRIVTVRGCAEERGALLGCLLGESISELVELRQSMYSAKGLAHWANLARDAAPIWKEWAPCSWAELQGMRRAGMASQEQLCMLGTDFEMQMMSWKEEDFFAEVEAQPEAAGRCTAFAVTDAGAPNLPGPLCGQNVDEEPSGWLDGVKDVVVRHVADPQGAPDVLLYTHPGVPAYCGMNSAGLAVMDLFIDDGFRNAQGVPINVTLRDVLVHRDICGAVAYLESLPRMAPTTFMLAQGNVIATVEASAQRTVTAWVRGPGEQFHSNHPVVDHRMAGDCGDPGTCSDSRLRKIKEAVRAALPNLSCDDAKRILTETPPAHPIVAPTIARVVMEPAHGLMHVLFRGEEHWIAVGFADDAL